MIDKNEIKETVLEMHEAVGVKGADALMEETRFLKLVEITYLKKLIESVDELNSSICENMKQLDNTLYNFSVNNFIAHDGKPKCMVSLEKE